MKEREKLTKHPHPCGHTHVGLTQGHDSIIKWEALIMLRDPPSAMHRKGLSPEMSQRQCPRQASLCGPTMITAP